MKIALLFAIFLISIDSYSQKWCPPGAEWTIGWGGLWGYSGYNRISYEKDTMLLGQACKKLIGEGVQYDEIKKTAKEFTFTKPAFTYAQNDTIFQFDGSKFIAVYFFNAKVGDTLHFGNIEYCDDPPLVQYVDSIGTTVIFNDTLKFYRVKLLNLPWFFGEMSWTIIEKLGCLETNFYPSLMCAWDVDSYALCSYKDNEINWQASWSNDTCWAFTGTNDLFDQSLKITPNPATNYLNISSSFNDQIETVSIIDINGVIINNFKRLASIDISNIDISFLINGIYIIQIQTSDGNRYIRKFVKQDN